MTLHRASGGLVAAFHYASLYPDGVTAATTDELRQRGDELLAGGDSAPAAQALRVAIDRADRGKFEGRAPVSIGAYFGLMRVLREPGCLGPSIGAAPALTVLIPGDPRAGEERAISAQLAGCLPRAKAATAKAGVWTIQLQSPESLVGKN